MKTESDVLLYYNVERMQWWVSVLVFLDLSASPWTQNTSRISVVTGASIFLLTMRQAAHVPQNPCKSSS